MTSGLQTAISKNLQGMEATYAIPPLKIINHNTAIDINTNDDKAKAFTDSFFPKLPKVSSVPMIYEYSDPLPDPLPITSNRSKSKYFGFHHTRPVAQMTSQISSYKNPTT
jgi:hypothetical protein